ncbi:DNA binding domain-containing protein, excisionase family [Amycolatopsis xylanica]|uniref:DNA binding domain-containing protein, excisionase family n=1 Tax=Amycolatopsis xylanica TaxID=589385 RepID=A0A1H3LTE7_9PSEU|nr:helix-turn-helix domain-containing protein [Amycolatopsis xylanica]SDY67359.1 DNA binding domain-containing protein, excisionase family [Amycolatopsis xylanica]
MDQELYSVEQVADRLGLHVRTVRNYVRDGRLKAVRIGKQYRIAREDLEALTGGVVPATPRESAVRSRRVEVTTIVQVDAIDRDGASRVVLGLNASLQGREPGGPPVRIESAYDEERASLKVIVLASPLDTAKLLEIADMLMG